MKHRTFSSLAMMGLAVSFALALPAQAQQTNDAVNDFLGNYTGVHAGDLDVVTANVQFTSTSLIFSATMNGTIGATTKSLYVFGINRGNGGAPFAGIGVPGVRFDSVVTMNGQGVVVTGGQTQAPASISGNSFSFAVPLSLFASTGFAVNQYTYNLWPRLSAGGGTQPISDFAPDNSNLLVTAVPEPSQAAALGLGVLGIILVTKKRKVTRL